MNLDIVRAYSSLSSIRPLHRHDQHTKIRLVCSFAHFNVRSMLNEIETREKGVHIFQREKKGEEEKNEIRTHIHTSGNKRVCSGKNEPYYYYNECLLSVQRRYTK